MKNYIKRTLECIGIGGAAMLLFGCKTIVRENIFASIDTGLGATVAENKQTQSYELKAGYIHSQFYSIPTGKIVENNSTNNAMVTSTNGTVTNAQISNAANITPQMVSGIKASTSLADVLLGMNIAENFAVGKDAVNSPAAVAMYIADAKTATNAVQAAAAVQSISANTATNFYSAALEKSSADIFEQYQAVTNAAIKAQWDGIITNVTSFMDITNLVNRGSPADWNTVNTALKNRGLLK